MRCKSCDKNFSKGYHGKCPECHRKSVGVVTHYPDWTYTSKLEYGFYYEADNEDGYDEDRPY
jgi:hypothetical protein